VQVTGEDGPIQPTRALRTKDWSELLEIVSIRPDMIIDHVEDHPQPHSMRPINETTAISRCAVEVGRRKEINAVIAPTEGAGEVCHRYAFKKSDAGVCQRL
jgi:hypothetical protein